MPNSLRFLLSACGFLVLSLSPGLRGQPPQFDRLASLPSLIGTAPASPTWSPDSGRAAVLWNDHGMPFRELRLADASGGGLLASISLFKKPGVYQAGGAGAHATNVWHATTGEVDLFHYPQSRPENTVLSVQKRVDERKSGLRAETTRGRMTSWKEVRISDRASPIPPVFQEVQQ